MRTQETGDRTELGGLERSRICEAVLRAASAVRGHKSLPAGSPPRPSTAGARDQNCCPKNAIGDSVAPRPDRRRGRVPGARRTAPRMVSARGRDCPEGGRRAARVVGRPCPRRSVQGNWGRKRRLEDQRLRNWRETRTAKAARGKARLHATAGTGRRRACAPSTGSGWPRNSRIGPRRPKRHRIEICGRTGRRSHRTGPARHDRRAGSPRPRLTTRRPPSRPVRRTHGLRAWWADEWSANVRSRRCDQQARDANDEDEDRARGSPPVLLALFGNRTFRDRHHALVVGRVENTIHDPGWKRPARRDAVDLGTDQAGRGW